jgi:hypothetical protein
MIMRNARSRAAIGAEFLEGRELQTVLINPPVVEIRTALNPKPLPPIVYPL